MCICGEVKRTPFDCDSALIYSWDCQSIFEGLKVYMDQIHIFSVADGCAEIKTIARRKVWFDFEHFVKLSFSNVTFLAKCPVPFVVTQTSATEITPD